MNGFLEISKEVRFLNYKETQELKAAIDEQCVMFDTLVTNGVPQRDVHHFKRPDLPSGYTMGEVVITKCGKEHICRVDNCKDYAKSCKWKAEHGVVFVAFNKKQLREYVNLCKDGNTIDAYALAVSCVDLDASRLTKAQRKQWEEFNNSTNN